MDGSILILASYAFYFIRVHENLLSDPSNNKSVTSAATLQALNIIICVCVNLKCLLRKAVSLVKHFTKVTAGLSEV